MAEFLVLVGHGEAQHTGVEVTHLLRVVDPETGVAESGDRHGASVAAVGGVRPCRCGPDRPWVLA